MAVAALNGHGRDLEVLLLPGERHGVRGERALRHLAHAVRRIGTGRERRQVRLFEGRYAGAMEPMRHYIPLRKDFWNFDEVVARLEFRGDLPLQPAEILVQKLTLEVAQHLGEKTQLASLERRRVERAGQTNSARLVIDVITGIELIQKPEPLLRKGERERAARARARRYLRLCRANLFLRHFFQEKLKLPCRQIGDACCEF